MKHMDKEYTQSDNTLTLHESPREIGFHISSGDYFAFLATLMGFVEESLGMCEHSVDSPVSKEVARSIRHDLRYVQANYVIIPRQLGDIEEVREKGNLLA